MNRRNICYECEEPVYDMDVCCYECGRSYCSVCGEGYDPISRTCLLYAHANVYVNPSFTVGKLRQYEKDVPHLMNQYTEDIDFVADTDTDFVADADTDLLKDADLLKKLINHYKNVKNEEEILEEEHQYFFANLLLDEYREVFDFKCYDCTFPPVKQLFVIESDIQFYVRIQTAINAIRTINGLCLDNGVKILVYDLIETEYKFVINDKKFYTVYPDKILEHLYDDDIHGFRIYPMHLKMV